jgi:hypothetical protein
MIALLSMAEQRKVILIIQHYNFMKKILILSLLTLAACSITQKQGYYKGYELPAYKVEKQIEQFEFRKYDESLVAEIEVSGERKEAARKGFFTLADYIFGENEKDENISMTSPVTQIKDENQNWKIQFGMPKKYNLTNLPKAKDEKIKFIKLPSRKFIALRFSGLWNDKLIDEKKKELEEFATKENLQTIGNPIIAYYDDPFTFPWNRRNEVLWQIR